MQELRLMGVHEDGDHLLFGDDAGAMFKVRIDETLRVATQRVPRRQSRGTNAPKVALTPRDIQARIRSGASAEEVSIESGHDLDHIRRYELPVRAERDWIATQARGIEIASPSHHEDYRAAFGDQPATLEAMLAVRLRSIGVEPSSVVWDAWKRHDRGWDVVARFELPEDSTIDLGEEPPAQWLFEPARRQLSNANRWAQVLSELEPLDGPVPMRRLAAVNDTVFDVESAPTLEPETSDLLEVLRSRRGQRLGADEDSDDAFAMLLSRGPAPAAHPRDAQDDDAADTSDSAPDAAPTGSRSGSKDGKNAGVVEPALFGEDDDAGSTDEREDPTAPDVAVDETDTQDSGDTTDLGDEAEPKSALEKSGHRWGTARSKLLGRGRRTEDDDDADNVTFDELLEFGTDDDADRSSDGTEDVVAEEVVEEVVEEVDVTVETEAETDADTDAALTGAEEAPEAEVDTDVEDTEASDAAESSASTSPKPAAKPRTSSNSKSKSKQNRSSMPSWEDIVFRGRGD